MNELSTTTALYLLSKQIAQPTRHGNASCPCCFNPTRSFVPKQFLPHQFDFPIFDSHTHVHMIAPPPPPPPPPPPSKKTKISSTSVVLAISPDDWHDLFAHHAKNPQDTRIGVGIHPWFARAFPINEYLPALRRHLSANQSLIVGEIGLDKSARWIRDGDGSRDDNFDIQLNSFRRQFLLAGEYNRPTSVHLVNKVFVPFFDFLEEMRQANTPFPPTISLHSYSGTSEFAAKILRFEKMIDPPNSRFFFGFSNYVNFNDGRSEKSTKKLSDCLKRIPRDRILCESDTKGDCDNINEVYSTIESIASALDLDIATVANFTKKNGEAFLLQQQKQS